MPNPPVEWTRVKDKDTGHEYTVGFVDPEAHEVLGKKEAVDLQGNPLPPKHRLPRGQKADTGEESA